MTNEADRRALLTLARDAIVAHVNRLPVPSPRLEGVFARRGSAFVSLHGGDGSLRGCIGHLDGNEPLGDVIARCAIAASSQDPRFAAVCPDEIAAIQIELSLLGPMEAISTHTEIEVGRHGLVIEHGRHRGLLLPQVATEWEWDALTFLAHTCRKAGLPENAWRNGATLWRFEAEVFGESA